MKPFTIGVLKEPEYENRVSLTPETLAALHRQQVKILVEKGAGERQLLKV